MTTIRSTFLRAVIGLDAAACGLAGASMAFAAPALEAPLGLSTALMQPVGAFLLAYAGLLVFLASRPALPRGAVWALVAFNILWAVESFVLFGLGWAQPTALGIVAISVQAVAALIVADLQYLCLRRASRAVAA